MKFKPFAAGAFFAAMVFVSAHGWAQDAAPAVSQDSPLSVSGVTVDKTDKSAVDARKAAMAEARREAFRRLAARNPGPEGEAVALPADDALASVVQDIEITSERLSATRYVGTFTVRFRDEVREWVTVRDTPVAVTPPVPKPLLILPYYETAEGQLLLWEEGNAWLKAWQAAADDESMLVPEGDIEDVAAGSTDAVWSGDISVAAKLGQKYGADEVALAVANDAAPGALSIDLYLARGGKLETLPSLARPLKEGDRAAAFTSGMAAVKEALKTRPAFAPEVPAAPAAAPARIEADVFFARPAEWIDIQKKIAAAVPPVVMHLKSLSNGMARVELSYAPGLEALLQALLAQGIAMSKPAIEVNPEALSEDAAADTPVYELRLAAAGE